MRNIKVVSFIEKYLIPKWYKRKYVYRIGGRKHASGYWFMFLLPRCIRPNFDGEGALYRWLNFYFWKGIPYK